VRALSQIRLPETVDVYYGATVELILEGARRAGLSVQQDGHQVQLNGRRVSCRADAEKLNLGEIQPGQPNETALEVQREGLRHILDEAKSGRVDGIVTAPIRKAALAQMEDGPFPGQTELLHHHLAQDENLPLMCFLGGPFILGLCTVHLPLSQVSAAITESRIQMMMRRLRDIVQVSAGDSKGEPKLVLLGLNPHAGEQGLLGTEETTIMEPAVRRLRAEGMRVDGPLPADGFFARVCRLGVGPEPLGVMAMYHDQGLAPYKALCGGSSVNVTWGLSVPRTSPDHGTADDIAGRGVADAGAMEQAILKLLPFMGIK
jgi:4-hydroxythreonine-4-phosphate dehydrogenase